MKRQDQIKEMAKFHARCMTCDKDMQVAFADALRRGAQWADEHPHWISVEEEMPKETDMYIVVHHNVVCTMTWYDNLEEWAEIYVDENECVQSRRMDGVTHWMPLPQVPTVAKKMQQSKRKEVRNDVRQV